MVMIGNDDDQFFGRSRVEELSAVTVREGGLAAAAAGGCLSSSRVAAELSACRSSPTDKITH